MGDLYPKFKAAAVQAAAVFLDRDGSVGKACALIREAGGKGADLIVLPEVFIPGGPYWAWQMGMRSGMRFSAELFRNSVDVPGPDVARIGETAAGCGAYVVIGVNERENKSLYNTLLFFDRQGRLMGKHRKLKPTGSEKLVWAEGDGSTHRVYETDIGRLGGLICGEHTMALPGYTLAAMGEQVHVASWVGFAFADTSLSEICSRYHAIAYNTFVVCSQSVVDRSINQKLGIDTIKPGGAWTAIIEAGSGRLMAGPLAPEEEGIVYADIDLQDAHTHYFLHETTGHYWPKQFQVHFDARELRPLWVQKGGAAGVDETEEAERTLGRAKKGKVRKRR
jgi:predicted amidohydrolase